MRAALTAIALLGFAAVANVAAAAPASAISELNASAASTKVLASADLGSRASDPDFISFSQQEAPSPVVSVRVVFFGATATLRPRDLGKRLGQAGMGRFSAALRAPRKRSKSGIAVLLNDHNVHVSLKLGAHPQLTIRGTRPHVTAETKPGYSGVESSFSTLAGRSILAPKPGCTRSGARFVATLRNGSHISRDAWTSCASQR